MVIRDLNVKSVPVRKSKTNAPLIIDADCVLSIPVLPKLVKLVSGRRLEIL